MLQIRFSSDTGAKWLVDPVYSISGAGDQLFEGELKDAIAHIFVEEQKVRVSALKPIQINGEIVQEHVLNHGDVISIDSSVLHIFDPKISVAEKQQQTTQSSPVIQHYLVAVDPGQEVERIPLDSKLIIGRSIDCDVVMNDHRLSRQHAQITQELEGFVIKDLNSSNGTYVNGKRVVNAKIRDGDTVCFDRMCFRLSSADANDEDVEKTNLRPSIEQWQWLKENKTVPKTKKPKPRVQHQAKNDNPMPPLEPEEEVHSEGSISKIFILLVLLGLFMLGFYLVR
jgi:hypothetical protein